jgi:tRNA modification GTPase
MSDDTIFALATAAGRAGIAIIRVSGTDAFASVDQLTKSLGSKDRAIRTLRDPMTQSVLDRCLILKFQRAASFTGEDTVEYHLHGSIAVQSSVLKVLGSLPGLRLAEPGEFTRRALENGALDLSQVEALGDLINAETELQHQQAMRVFSGGLSNKVGEWRRKLVRVLALLDASIDFADEEIPESAVIEAVSLADNCVQEFQKQANGVKYSERLSTGFEVAIVGPPNVGKSSLLNTLADRDAAIASEIAGTTRDVIEVRMDIKGLPVTMIDTAGLRETDDLVESLGIEKAKQRAADADLRIFLVDHEVSIEEMPVKFRTNDIVRMSKGDLRQSSGLPKISSVTGMGIQELIDDVFVRLSEAQVPDVVAVKARHKIALEKAATALERMKTALERSTEDLDVAAEEVRRAIHQLDCLIGQIGVDDILDEIFSSFCLGK